MINTLLYYIIWRRRQEEYYDQDDDDDYGNDGEDEFNDSRDRNPLWFFR